MDFVCSYCGHIEVWKNGFYEVKTKDFGDLDKSEEEKVKVVQRYRCKKCDKRVYPLDEEITYRHWRGISLRLEREILDLKFNGKMTYHNIQDHLRKHRRVHVSIGEIGKIVNEAGIRSAEVLKKLE